MENNSQNINDETVKANENDTEIAEEEMDVTAEEPVEAPSESEGSAEDKATELILKMKEELEKKNTEIAQLKDLMIRRQADFENHKKRIARQEEMNKKMVVKDIALDIIGINDNLIRASEAAEHVSEGEDLANAHKSYVEGVMMISKSIEDMLGSHGIEEVEALNQPFDPNQHEALEIAMSDEVDSDMVTKVFQKGFKMEDFILRSAKVCVSRPQPKAAAEKDEEKAPDTEKQD